jgi:hypothetical protein
MAHLVLLTAVLLKQVTEEKLHLARLVYPEQLWLELVEVADRGAMQQLIRKVLAAVLEDILGRVVAVAILFLVEVAVLLLLVKMVVVVYITEAVLGYLVKELLEQALVKAEVEEQTVLIILAENMVEARVMASRPTVRYVLFGPVALVNFQTLVLAHLNFLGTNNGTFYSYQRRSAI